MLDNDTSLYQPMPKTKIEAFFREFPWLDRYVSQKIAKCLFVKRVEISLLPRYPLTTTEYTADMGIWEGLFWNTLEAKVRILDTDGSELLQVGRWEVVTPIKVIPARPGNWLWKDRLAVEVPEKREWRVEPETFQSAIDRLGLIEDKKDKGFFILSILESVNHGAEVIIYKTPKGYNLNSWVKSEIERERRTIQAECAQIDAEAEKVSA